MRIVRYDEVEDWEMTELNLACFDHPYSKKRVEEWIERDCRVPDWGGELYASDGEKILGVVGIIYPKIRTSEGIQKVGGIRNVCTRPSESEKGVAKSLLEKAHEIMSEEVRLSFLLTSASFKAHNLYSKLGYLDIHTPPVAYKKVEGRESEIQLRAEEVPEYVRSTYRKSVEGLNGLVVREEDFWRAAKVRGWPENDKVRIAYDGKEEKIGYIRFVEKRKHLTCDEIAAEEPADLPRILRSLEDRTEKRHIVVKLVNPNYKDILKNYGFGYSKDGWDRIMVKDLKNETEKTLKKSRLENNFHIGIYESY